MPTEPLDVLDLETLTLATAQRQLLAARVTASAEHVVDHLIGLQAQEPFEPYVGLFSRVVGFDPRELAAALEDRAVARTHVMRRTVHLLTRTDAPGVRGLHDVMLRQKSGHVLNQMRGPDGVVVPVDLDALAAATADLFHAQPQQLAAVGRAVEPRFPGSLPRTLGDAAASLLPLVQTTPRAVWGSRGPASYTTYSAWWGEGAAPPELDPAQELTARGELVLRYLAAYGPAATADVRAWSGATGFPEAVLALGDRLRRYRDERGRVLLDLADRPVLDPGLPADTTDLPVRLLPAFDNAVLGYGDRSRIIDDAHKSLSVAGARFVLVRGRVAGTWQPDRIGLDDEPVTVTVTPLRALTRPERTAVRAEAHAVAAFLGQRPGRVEVLAS